MTRISARTAAVAVAIAAPLTATADETRLPQDAWDQEFAGMYAVEGRCEDPELIWVLHPVTLQAGRLNCNGIGKVTWDSENVLAVPVSQCTFRGEDVPDRIMHFNEIRPGIVDAIDTQNGEQASLKRCPE